MRMRGYVLAGAAVLALLIGANTVLRREPREADGPCNGGLVLHEGFCATIFADTLGALRHLVVAPNGDVYAARWEGKTHPGGIVILRDTTEDGRADVIISVANSGGSGLAAYDGYLFQSTWSEVLRYKFRADGALDRGVAPDTIVLGLPRSGHAARSIAFDSVGGLYVNIGAPTNSCQIIDKGVRSMGRDPCIERDSFAGIWRFDATRLRQRQSDGKRWAYGLRHVVALTVDARTGVLFGVQHGRDDLHENFPHLYEESRGAKLPAEVMYRIDEGKDYGWPYCYFDGTLGRAILAPEYGGDGARTTRCESLPAPVATFPAHWAPNGLLFYQGAQFPARYRGGAFVAFHGGWYRPPPDNGFNVVFVPFSSGTPSGPFEIFADGFAGSSKRPARASHRPVGLAESPDGALFVSDDKGGRIWRITYSHPGSEPARATTKSSGK